MSDHDTPGLAAYQSLTFTSDTEAHNAMSEEHHNAWTELKDGIAQASDLPDVLLARGRAEGYLLALEHSHVIDHGEWRRFSALLSTAVATRNEQLSHNA